MTPEQLASMPSHTPASEIVMRDAVGRLRVLADEVRSIRFQRAVIEYPPGHSDRENKLPKWVLDREASYG